MLTQHDGVEAEPGAAEGLRSQANPSPVEWRPSDEIEFDDGEEYREDEVRRLLAEDARVPWRTVAVVGGLMFTLLVLGLVQGGKGRASIFGIPCGSMLYWLFVIAPIPVCGAVVMWQLRRLIDSVAHKTSVGYPFVKVGTVGSKVQSYPNSALFYNERAMYGGRQRCEPLIRTASSVWLSHAWRSLACDGW